VKTGDNSILVIRLGAMGDIVHTLPAVASLKRSFPEWRLRWVVARKWTALLEGNPNIDEIVPFERGGMSALLGSWRRLRRTRPELAIDFQGLIQSALVGWVSRPKTYFGLDKSLARERLAASFYTRCILALGPHRVERNLQLAAAAGAGRLREDAATPPWMSSWLPQGRPEGQLPAGPFVLANPFAGWVSKQWPIASYEALAERLKDQGLAMVVNVPRESAQLIERLVHLQLHVSGIGGLIDATRRATAVVGVDSGPLHLAAALGKPGVALFGPTDPAQTGPFRSRMTVLRAPGAATTYKRDGEIHASMKDLTVDQVAKALVKSIAAASPAAVHSS
jgi:heptosyltransferase-1